MFTGVYPCSTSIPESPHGPNKRLRPWKTQQMQNAFTSVSLVNCFCSDGHENIFLCWKIINWVVSCHGCSIWFIADFVSYCAGLHSQHSPGLINIEWIGPLLLKSQRQNCHSFRHVDSSLLYCFPFYFFFYTYFVSLLILPGRSGFHSGINKSSKHF